MNNLNLPKLFFAAAIATGAPSDLFAQANGSLNSVASVTASMNAAVNAANRSHAAGSGGTPSGS